QTSSGARSSVTERCPALDVMSRSSGSRHKAEKINPKKKLKIPRAAKAPRQPPTNTNGAATEATTTPPPGTPACLMPMAVARSSRSNHAIPPLLEAGFKKLYPRPARKKLAQAQAKDGAIAAATVQKPKTTCPCKVVFRMPRRSVIQPAPKEAPVIARENEEKNRPTCARESPSSS